MSGWLLQQPPGRLPWVWKHDVLSALRAHHVQANAPGTTPTAHRTAGALATGTRRWAWLLTASSLAHLVQTPGHRHAYQWQNRWEAQAPKGKSRGRRSAQERLLARAPLACRGLPTPPGESYSRRARTGRDIAYAKRDTLALTSASCTTKPLRDKQLAGNSTLVTTSLT
ncbi:hypothetical protein NDU88_007403 [Pleurodeles waltl]|uniref:Uncharacterized protein n=1 Tax=Pleurodeles waltl TaxID=8319 RepID=A0AAV7SSN1_PLEWA|nr:hypothetical protein NDU88_007403 [Pleurodeles waltl]